MAEEEMSMNEILESIRQTLSGELDENTTKGQLDAGLEDVFVLTPEMRYNENSTTLEEKMRRVLEKMSSEPIELKKKTISDELYPLLKEWMTRMRPDLSSEAISTELEKIIPHH